VYQRVAPQGLPKGSVIARVYPMRNEVRATDVKFIARENLFVLANEIDSNPSFRIRQFGW